MKHPNRSLHAAMLAPLVIAAGSAWAVMTAAENPGGKPPADLADWPVPDLAGVAKLSNGCSAVLLQGGRHLLGAAHCAAGAGSTATLGSGETVRIAAVATAPGWAGAAAIHDLAVMSLEAPYARSNGYRLASVDLVEAMPAVLVAGYGGGGTPAAPQAAGTLRHGYNEYDAKFNPPGQPLPPDGPRVRLFDFDDGSFASNTLGLRPGGVSSLGLGPMEAMLAGLDSGGPSFVPVKQAGWRSWLRGDSAWEWQIAGIHVSIDGTRGSAFGGIGMDLLVGPYSDWISTVVRGP